MIRSVKFMRYKLLIVFVMITKDQKVKSGSVAGKASDRLQNGESIKS